VTAASQSVSHYTTLQAGSTWLSYTLTVLLFREFFSFESAVGISASLFFSDKVMVY